MNFKEMFMTFKDDEKFFCKNFPSDFTLNFKNKSIMLNYVNLERTVHNKDGSYIFFIKYPAINIDLLKMLNKKILTITREYDVKNVENGDKYKFKETFKNGNIVKYETYTDSGNYYYVNLVIKAKKKIDSNY